MPQNPRAPSEQARIIKNRLVKLSQSNGPLSNVDPAPASLDEGDLLEMIDPDAPWPVNLRTVMLTLLPTLDTGVGVGAE